MDAKTRERLGPNQCNMALALYHGLVPPELRQDIADLLSKDVKAHGDHLTTGFLGTPVLLPALSRNGHHEQAFRVATQKTFPSWGYIFEMGATSMWENWNGKTGKGFANPVMNSFNHFAKGTVVNWFYEDIAGIRPEAPAFKSISFHPRPVGDLTWAKAEHHSMHGLIRSAWKIGKGNFTMEILIPANTTATVHVPCQDAKDVTESGKPAGKAEGVKFIKSEVGDTVYAVAAGRYTFECPLFRRPDHQSHPGE